MNPLFAESVEAAMKARIRELEASLVAAEAAYGEMQHDRDVWQERAEIAREALERINDDEHSEDCHVADQVRGQCQCALFLAAEALAALDGEGEAE